MEMVDMSVLKSDAIVRVGSSPTRSTIFFLLPRIPYICVKYAWIAQLVEHVICNLDVASSTLVPGSEYGSLAQLVRVSGLHPEGHWFDSNNSHSFFLFPYTWNANIFTLLKTV